MGDPGDEDPPTVARTFTPSGVGSLSDDKLLPRRVDNLAREVRELADLITRKMLPAFERIAERLAEDNSDINRLRRDHHALSDRVDDTYEKILILEAAAGI